VQYFIIKSAITHAMRDMLHVLGTNFGLKTEQRVRKNLDGVVDRLQTRWATTGQEGSNKEPAPGSNG